MPAIILPSLWRRQPTVAAGIKRSNSIARGIQTLVLPHLEYDAARGIKNTGSGASLRGTNLGVAANFNGSSDYQNYSGCGERTATIENTTFALCYINSSKTQIVFGQWKNASEASWQIYFDSSNRVNCTYLVPGPGYPGATGEAISLNTVVLIGASKSASGIRTWVNGKGSSYSTPPGYELAITNGGSASVEVGRNDNGSNYLDGGVLLAGSFSRELSDSEWLELNKNPWQLFRNSPRILYFPSAGGGATDIAGALESISLSTFGATVGSARDVAAALESLALTTSAATVSSDRAITASVESISLTTSQARIASDRAVSAATEQLTVTPAAASVALVAGIAAGTEALSVTANPATVALAASIAATREAITVTGLSATVSAGSDNNISATLESITVTGLTATVQAGSDNNIAAALESITVTVNPATVSRNTALAAALESLTVTPHAASIAVGQIVAAALESLTLTSYPAGIALDVAIAAQLEQINLTTLAAQVGLGTNVAALTEALTLTPHGATLTFAPSVGAATEYITLTTFAAVVGATEAALLSPGLEFTIPLSRLGYTIPLSRVHFTIPQE